MYLFKFLNFKSFILFILIILINFLVLNFKNKIATTLNINETQIVENSYHSHATNWGNMFFY